MTLEEGHEMAKKCVDQVRTRFLINQRKFIIKVVDKTGTKTLEID